MTSATSIHWNEDLIRGERVKNPARSRRLPRDKIYIIKDIIVKLLGTGEMNKSMLLSMCGLNSKIHGEILDDLESRNLVARKNTLNGAKEVSFYNVTHDGIQFYRNILSPFEEVFPRKKRSADDYQEQWC